MKRSLCAVRGHFRHYPAKKVDPEFVKKTVELFVDLKTRDLEFDLEAFLLDELSKGTGFELHGGLV